MSFARCPCACFIDAWSSFYIRIWIFLHIFTASIIVASSFQNASRKIGTHKKDYMRFKLISFVGYYPWSKITFHSRIDITLYRLIIRIIWGYFALLPRCLPASNWVLDYWISLTNSYNIKCTYIMFTPRYFFRSLLFFKNKNGLLCLRYILVHVMW